ncbi:ABC transporter permease subunit [bacterium]|nr:ABC transporter permease subunit [bacterium]
MLSSLRNLWLIGKTILIESVRRREIYIVVLVALAMIISLRFFSFFDLEGLGKFYREVAMKIMNVATGLTVIVLSARQLPREFTQRTLYPLLAKPVSRFAFVMGKFFGVLMAAAFCYAIFMVIFILGNLTLKTPFNVPLFIQGIYLQLWSLAILAAMSFLLSLLLNTDAAVTIATILYLGSQILLAMLTYVYPEMGPIYRKVIVVVLYAIPQLTLFDASGRIVHGIWDALSLKTMMGLTLYGAIYTGLYLGLASWLFRRRAL